MAEIYKSIIEIEERFYPKTHQMNLAKKGLVERLIEYSKEQQLEIGDGVLSELTKNGNLSKLIALRTMN